VATVIALASAWHTAERMWRHLDEQRRVYANYTDTQRRHAPLDAMGVPSDIFDFYRQYLVRGDRVYFQVRESGYSAFYDLPTAIRFAGHYYLLPAIQAKDLADATVVVTFFDDPGRLPVRYVTQQQAGIQPIFVSRIRAP
jgi:hypothetical protein